ncbi:MAG: archease [Brevinematales bacterium]|nr:archease [Brevinematales bacterium]
MFEYFDHPADIGIRGIGDSYKEAFCEAAKSVMNIMADVEMFTKEYEVEVEVSGMDRDFLFLNFINRIIFEAGIHRAIWVDFEILEMNDNYLKFKMCGEKIKTNHKGALKVEVKAATLSELKLYEENGKYLAQCFEDI